MAANDKIKITFLPNGMRAMAPIGTNIMDAADKAGVFIDGICGRKGTCGKCLARLVSGKLSAATDTEKKHLGDSKLEEGLFLACQRQALGDLVLEVQAEVETKQASGSDAAKRVETGYLFEVDSGLTKQYLELPKPTIDDQRPDLERLLHRLPQGAFFDIEVARKLPKVLRDNDFNVTAVMLENKLTVVEPGDTTGYKYGVAFDIGTTTVAGYLVDLSDGKVIGSASANNRQGIHGADVISRIDYTMHNPEGLSRLQKLVANSMEEVLSRLVDRTKIDARYIYELVAVGNTTMSHILLGISPASLAPAPFIPVFSGSISTDAKTFGLNVVPPEARVTVLPNVAGYVGSDTVGVMLATAINERKGTWLAVDIGTNGEIVLSVSGRLYTCSTAAGPAFEGAGIKQGMRAGRGAINNFRIIDGDVDLHIVGNKKAKGICGSGLVDVVSELVRTGIIQRNGRIGKPQDPSDILSDKITDRIVKGDHGNEFVLAEGDPGVRLFQKDISELQLAKGAIRAGIEVLMQKAGVTVDHINGVLLAGAFGANLRVESIIGIGMLPNIKPELVSAVGNAAGMGALLALTSTVKRGQADELAKEAEHVELSSSKEFHDTFVKSLTFPV
ncbi:MAG TPA: ASKHA domain-containing protein [Clostridia bacterium]|nr:ASKHA domain-containing protein [Clostridia bacterium]